MKLGTWVLFAVLVCSLAACKPTREEAITSVHQAEDSLKVSFSGGVPDTNLIGDAIKSYVDFADNYPDDSLAPHFLIKGGDYNRVLKRFDKAIALYEKVEKDYPGTEAAANAAFLQAFVYDNEVGDIEKARGKYQDFMKKYPSHQLASAAQYSLENLGVTPEELVRRFEEQRQKEADSIAVANAGSAKKVQ